MTDYWAGALDWRAQEVAINAVPQFRVEIDGLLVHYVHVRANTADPIPLVLTHGWPWAFWDFKDSDVFSVFDRDFLCSTASIYGLTRTIGTSIRLYSDHYRHGWAPRHGGSPIITAPTGFGIYPKDVVFVPRALAERATNLVRWTVMPRGGHYGPSEQPVATAAELTAFFHSLRDAA